jgi:hypothetical protein
MASLCALVFGATLAQLGLVTPLIGLAISTASLPLSFLSITGSLWRVGQRASLLSVFTSIAAWPAPVLLGPQVVDGVLLHMQVRHLSAEPIRTELLPEPALSIAAELVKTHPDWRITRTDRERREIEVIALTQVFQFRNEFAIRARRADNVTVIDIQLRSRVGKYDFAGTMRSLDSFRDELRTRLANSGVVQSRDRRDITL